MTFHHLAEMILRQTDKPLTANEIWQQAGQEGLDQQLNSQGETLFIDARELGRMISRKQRQLTDEEVQQLVTNCDRFVRLAAQLFEQMQEGQKRDGAIRENLKLLGHE